MSASAFVRPGASGSTSARTGAGRRGGWTRSRTGWTVAGRGRAGAAGCFGAGFGPADGSGWNLVGLPGASGRPRAGLVARGSSAPAVGRSDGTRRMALQPAQRTALPGFARVP